MWRRSYDRRKSTSIPMHGLSGHCRGGAAEQCLYFGQSAKSNAVDQQCHCFTTFQSTKTSKWTGSLTCTEACKVGNCNISAWTSGQSKISLTSRSWFSLLSTSDVDLIAILYSAMWLILTQPKIQRCFLHVSAGKIESVPCTQSFWRDSEIDSSQANEMWPRPHHHIPNRYPNFEPCSRFLVD